MAYLEDFEQLLKEKCYQNEIPSCSAACPFNLDIHDLVKKWKKGRFNAAYRTFQNSVGFPGIVAAACDHPCMERCIRREIDESVDLHLLEQSMAAFATRKDPNAYNMPEKPDSCAIVGGGISGLACALFLCNKKYQVTIFEKSDHLGGSLRDVMDCAVFDRDIETQFMNEHYKLELNHEVRELSELSGFDAIYVAIGDGADGFGLAASGEGAFASNVKGVFFGGRMCGRTHMEAISDGIFASHAIERYFKTKLMNQPEERKNTKLKINSSKYEKKERTKPSCGALYNEEEAAAESDRCVLCSCDACMRSCDLMSYFDKTPRRIYEEVYVTIRPGTLSRDGTMATRLISTCNQCGACKDACPEHIDFGKFFADSMKVMQQKGAMPWVYHDYWLRDMAFSNGDGAVFIPADGPTKYLFFPGCQMGASEPAYVEKTFEWLRTKEPATALWVHCCGAPAEWAGEEALHKEVVDSIRDKWKELGRPTVIIGCPTCIQMFDRFLPEIEYTYIYEKMTEWDVRGADPDRTYKIFDACAARDYSDLRADVRAAAGAAGIATDDIVYADGTLPCCSFGGHTSIAASKYSKRVAEKRMREIDGPILTYCVNCRDNFAAQGKEVYHMLDLLFGINDEKRDAPLLTKRWENREQLRDTLCARYLGTEPARREKMKLYMSEETAQRLSADMILESDIEQVIGNCERLDKKIEDTETGHFYGHLKIKNMTYWVEYRPEGDGYELFGAYCHRMCLEAEDDKK